MRITHFVRISFDLCMSMLFLSYVFCLDLTFAFFVKMSTQQLHPLSQIGLLSLPDPSAGTLGHYQGIPLRPGTLEEARTRGAWEWRRWWGGQRGWPLPPS